MRQIEVGEDVPNAVTIGIEQSADGAIVAAVWWPSRGDMDADEVSYDSVPEALKAAQAAQQLHGFAEIVVALQSDDLWQDAWGSLENSTPGLSEDEAFELASAIEASRDA